MEYQKTMVLWLKAGMKGINNKPISNIYEQGYLQSLGTIWLKEMDKKSVTNNFLIN